MLEMVMTTKWITHLTSVSRCQPFGMSCCVLSTRERGGKSVVWRSCHRCLRTVHPPGTGSQSIAKNYLHSCHLRPSPPSWLSGLLFSMNPIYGENLLPRRQSRTISCELRDSFSPPTGDFRQQGWATSTPRHRESTVCIQPHAIDMVYSPVVVDM